MAEQGGAAAAIARMDQITREMADRRALRERSADQAKQKSRESLQAQGPVAEKVAKHLGELGRRQRKAGGWATEKTLAGNEHTLGLGIEEDEGERVPPPAAQPPRYPAAPVAEAPAPPPEPAEPPRPAARPSRPAPDLDDDDFSEQTWMR